MNVLQLDCQREVGRVHAAGGERLGLRAVVAYGLAVRRHLEAGYVLVVSAGERGDGLLVERLARDLAEERVFEIVQILPDGDGRKGKEVARHLGEAEADVGAALRAVPRHVAQLGERADGVGYHAVLAHEVHVAQEDAGIEGRPVLVDGDGARLLLPVLRGAVVLVLAELHAVQVLDLRRVHPVFVALELDLLPRAGGHVAEVVVELDDEDERLVADLAVVVGRAEPHLDDSEREERLQHGAA